MTDRKKLYLIDGNAYVHRAYHALPPNLTTSSGQMVNAVYGFTRMLLRIMKQEKPDYIAVCFDSPAPTFRHREYEDYKATRKETPQELKDQIPLAQKIVKAFNIPLFAKEGYEADDLIGTLTRKAEKEGIETVIVTGDKDALQLVNERVKVLNEPKGVLYTPDKVREEFGVQPGQIVDLLALIGTPGRYVIRRVYTREEPRDVAAAVSTTRLNLIAGKYVGKDDPVAIVRAQSKFPALGEVLEPFAFPHLVAGWMRGSHHGPLMPVGEKDAKPSRFDGPPRVVALGFNIKNAKLIGPSDLFADVAFDRARALANEMADYLRRHGPFMPHRLGPEEMEYTTLPHVMEKLKDRFRLFEEG